jgi:hypothetical protein
MTALSGIRTIRQHLFTLSLYRILVLSLVRFGFWPGTALMTALSAVYDSTMSHMLVPDPAEEGLPKARGDRH